MNIFIKFLIPIALIASFLWGISPIINKIVLKTIDPRLIMILSSFFYMLCIIIFSIYNWKSLKIEAKKLDRRSIMLIAISSIIGSFVATLLFFYLLKDNDSYIVTALTFSSPVFTLLLAYLILKEKITMIGLTGVLMIFGGILCIAFNNK